MLVQLAEQGIQLFIDGKQLGVTSDCELTPQHRQLITQHKQQLLSELAHQKDRYKTTMKQLSSKERTYQYYQRPNESDDDYLGRVLDESFN
tara:strand:- start:951 stop:1223 length:273 start_codon:yes stop_codon:yes gene_type:complete